MPTLTVASGSFIGRIFPLTHRALSLGRAPARDIQLLDQSVSRRHAVVRLRDGHAVLTPLSSRNGTAINGRRVNADAVLRDGDLITLGGTALKFEAVREAPLAVSLTEPKRTDSFALTRPTLAADPASAYQPVIA